MRHKSFTTLAAIASPAFMSHPPAWTVGVSRTDARIHDLAAAQHNLITTSQALACGMSRSATIRRVDDGRWVRVHSGVPDRAGPADVGAARARRVPRGRS